MKLVIFPESSHFLDILGNNALAQQSRFPSIHQCLCGVTKLDRIRNEKIIRRATNVGSQRKPQKGA